MLHAAGIPSFLLCPLATGRSGRALRELRLDEPSASSRARSWDRGEAPETYPSAL